MFPKEEFIKALKISNCIGGDSGWIPQPHNELVLFAKSHSYGEYIFDWAWAEAYERYGVPYYPKYTSMIPFTPVTTRHFLMPKFDENKAQTILSQHEQEFEDSDKSSTHFLFLHPDEKNLFLARHFILRESFQYHFFNQNYSDFDNFLNALKTKKAKNIRSERQFPDLIIRQYTGAELTQAHAERMYEFYISTIVNKNSFDYLNKQFFEVIFGSMKDSLLYIEATQNDVPVAGSLFFYGPETLYGRYWGSSKYVENLHFEMCYYQGIDFAIKNKLKVFEAGAQGEHKIARGFRPVRIYSAHKIKHHAFDEAIRNFVQTEKKHVEKTIEQLTQFLPYKKL